MAQNKILIKGEIQNVRVVIRIRPLNKKEQSEGYKNIVSVNQEENVINLAKPTNNTNEKPKSFKFDHIFHEDCTQVSVSRT